MKIHKHLVSVVVEALDSIFEEGQYADKVIQRNLKAQKQWGARDRRFFAESVYEIVRWERLLNYLAESDDFWFIWGAYWIKQGNEALPDWPELGDLNESEVRARLKNLPSFAVAQSIPDWMEKRLHQELGEDYKDVVRALNQPAEVFLRTNILKTNPDDLIKTLADAGVMAVKVEGLPHTLKLHERKNVFITEPFKKGLFEVQDAASQMVVPLLDIQPGQRVVDACAGAGGKSLHMASLMKNKGKILSLDIHEWKLNELKVRARRAGVDVIETRVIESSKVIKRLESSADRVLLDVPCSGIGVLRRNPDSKWKLTEDEITRLHTLQYEILTQYSNMTKKGGKMVYATCSLLPSENEQQIAKFLKEHGEKWRLLEELHLRPDREGFDGFYAASLERLQ